MSALSVTILGFCGGIACLAISITLSSFLFISLSILVVSDIIYVCFLVDFLDIIYMVSFFTPKKRVCLIVIFED